MKKTKGILACILLIFATTAFAQQVQETDDIDSFINDDKPKSTSTTTSTSTSKRQAADSVIAHKIFSLGIGLNFGFFVGDMDDANRYILEDVNEKEDDLWGDSITMGDAEMYLNLVPRFTINIMPVRYFLIQFVGEVAWGPKIIITLNDTYSYHYMRYSPGIILNAYLPLGKTKKYSLFLGGGAFYHFLEFGSYSVDGFGGRGQFGLRIDWKSTALEVFAAYDYARGETGKYNPHIDRDMLLDYSSILLGINLYFKIL